MSAIKFFVSKSGTAIIECPQCENSKSISVSAYQGKKFSTKVKCPCGHVFAINFDFRQHYRKSTLLEGNYRKSNLNIKSYYEKLPNKTRVTHKQMRDGVNNCTVKDLSIGGIGLDIWGQHSIEEGDELLVEFKLNNKRHTVIKREVIVKTVHENYVGAEFQDDFDHHPDLGFYLMS